MVKDSNVSNLVFIHQGFRPVLNVEEEINEPLYAHHNRLSLVAVLALRHPFIHNQAFPSVRSFYLKVASISKLITSDEKLKKTFCIF